jgi:hypothetical protein
MNKERIALMNKGALIINCARGGLIDEAALKDAIDSGHIAGCGLDVFEDEPPSADHPLFGLRKHIAFTPHLGASTNEAQENVGIEVAIQIRDFLTTGEIRNAINMPSLDAAALAAIGPYLELAGALGTLLAKLGPANPDSIRVSYHGDLATKDTGLISRTALYRLLECSRPDGQVNLVNAPAIAKAMGLDLVESTISAQTEFNDLLVVELRKGTKVTEQSADAKYNSLDKYAINLNSYVLLYLPKDKITNEIMELAVQKNGFSLLYIQKNKMTNQIIELAVKNNGFSLLYVPKDKITNEIIELAVKNNGLSLKYVPKDKITNKHYKLTSTVLLS